VSDLGLQAADPLSLQGNSLAEGGDYLALLKPRVMSLVVFTAFVGMAIAPGHLHPFLAFTALLCIAVGAGASGALNMWFDADIDLQMARTATRPIPTGHISPGEALAFGLILSVASVTVLALAINWLAAGLLAFTIFFYAVIYTMWLKRWTAQNIVIGGAAGALPPVIGWAAMTNGTAIEPWVLFLIIFLWTPPHFWALALNKVEDYRRVGVPMLPVVVGAAATRFQIMAYTLALAAASALPVALGFAGALYAACAAGLGIGFIYYAADLWLRPDGPTAKSKPMKVFAFSIFYLFAVFACLPIERWLGLAPLVAAP
jgi:protoheme IX farnesyltransferase